MKRRLKNTKLPSWNEHWKSILREVMFLWIIGRNFLQILNRKHVMVRVGGGWQTFEEYLIRHDPQRISVFNREGVAMLDNTARPTSDRGFLVASSTYKSPSLNQWCCWQNLSKSDTTSMTIHATSMMIDATLMMIDATLMMIDATSMMIDGTLTMIDATSMFFLAASIIIYNHPEVYSRRSLIQPTIYGRGASVFGLITDNRMSNGNRCNCFSWDLNVSLSFTFNDFFHSQF